MERRLTAGTAKHPLDKPSLSQESLITMHTAI